MVLLITTLLRAPLINILILHARRYFLNVTIAWEHGYYSERQYSHNKRTETEVETLKGSTSFKEEHKQ